VIFHGLIAYPLKGLSWFKIVSVLKGGKGKAGNAFINKKSKPWYVCLKNGCALKLFLNHIGTEET
jgi:hypothetical protein